jgi:CBS domain-containing protein
MTKPVISGTPEMTIGSISSIFKDQKINRLPIADNKGGIVGIVTRTDVARAYHVFAERPQK